MLINLKINSDYVSISKKKGCLTLSYQSRSKVEIFSYDFSGRPWTALLGDLTYQRGLNGEILLSRLVDGHKQNIKRLSFNENEQFHELARHKIMDLLAYITDKKNAPPPHISDEIMKTLRNIVSFDFVKSKDDLANYHTIYKPVGILPPDQYMAVILQATTGCSHNACTFCNFYKNTPYKEKSPSEFSTHMAQVKSFLGEGLSLRRTIFLGDANALSIPFIRLVNLFQLIPIFFNVDELGGIYSFQDGFNGVQKTIEEYKDLASKGLKGVCIGLESGNADIFRRLNKPGNPDNVVETVLRLKEAGVSVGVIILTGIGGNIFYHRHVQDTISIINSMHLDMNDMIYFSHYVNTTQSTEIYLSRTLTYQEQEMQAGLIEKGFRFDGESTPHISRYDISNFVY